MSSFVKFKKDDTADIKGVRTSIRNGKVTSTGSDSFDFVIGGGLEISSLALIGEDKYGRHANVTTKLFLADGFHHQHKIYFANLDEDPRELIKDIPPGAEQPKESTTEASSNDLRIAFRYQAMPQIDSVQRGHQSNVSYDLSKKLDKDVIESSRNISFFSFSDFKARARQMESASATQRTAFQMILDDVQTLAKDNQENLLRICINSVGSALWYSETFHIDVLRFLAQLKSIVRYNDNVVCFMTMPLHLISLIDDQLIFKIRKLVDVNVNLESFDNVEKKTNAVFKQYHGLVHIKKLQTIIAHQSHKPESYDLAFKLKSHRFVIEKLHLPPELDDNNTSSDSSRPSMSCATSGGGNKSLDF